MRLEGRLVTHAGGLLPCTPRTRRGPCEGGAGSRQGCATLERTLLSTEMWKNNKKMIKTPHLHKCQTLHARTHTHTQRESAEKGLPARPPRCGPPRPWEDARHRGHLQALMAGWPRAHFRQPFGWACAPGPLPAHSLPCPGCPVPVTPAASLTPPHHVQPLPASLLLPSLRQLYRLIRIRHHCFSHLLVSCLPLPLETEPPAGSRLGPFCSQLSLRPSGCLAHRTCSGVFVEGTCDPT